MVLHVESYTAYLAMPEARSCYTVHFYLRYWPSPSPIKPNHGPIHTECKKIHIVVSSAAEAKTFGIFNNGKTDIGMQPALITLGHKQPATPLKPEKYTIEVFLNLGIKPKHSKPWDIKWHWLRYKEVLDQLIVY